MQKYNLLTTGKFLTLGLSLGITGLVTSSAIAQGAEAAAEESAKVEAKVEAKASLDVGDAMPADVFAGVTWVQGEEVKSLDEKGKVYILESWATWCGPCVAMIPHVNELHNKFESKGLVVIGMNVWEDGIEKSQEFVKKKGDGMAYRVAYSGGRESAFSSNVLRPAGAKGIPFAMIVKDGKLVMATHPSRITDVLIEEIIGGSFNAEEYAKKEAAKEKEREDLISKIRPLQEAGDWAGMKKLAEGLEDSNSIKFGLLAQAAVMSNNWGDLQALRNDIKKERFSSSLKAYMLDGGVVRDAIITEDAAGAKAYAEIALADARELAADASADRASDYHFSKARLYFMVGNVEEAKKELASSVEFAEQIKDPRAKAYFGNLAKAALEKVGEGSFPNSMSLLRKK